MTSLCPVLRDPRFLCSNDQAGSVHWRKEGGGNGNSKVSHTRFVRRSLTVVNYTNSPSYFPTIKVMLIYDILSKRHEKWVYQRYAEQVRLTGQHFRLSQKKHYLKGINL